MHCLCHGTPVRRSQSEAVPDWVCGSGDRAARARPCRSKEIRQRFFSVEQYETDASAQGRIDSWNAAWAIAKEYPSSASACETLRSSLIATALTRRDERFTACTLRCLQTQVFQALTMDSAVLATAALSLRRVRHRAKASTSSDAERLYATACAIEASLAVFCVGAAFLSLELFELPYLLILLSCELPLLAAGPVLGKMRAR